MFDIRQKSARSSYKVFRFHCCDQCYSSVVCLYVCLSVCVSYSCNMLKRQKISTQFLLHMPAPCLSQIMLIFGLHRSTPSYPNFAPKWPTPCWLERRRHLIVAEWWEVANWSQWWAYRYLPSLFQVIPLLTPYDLHFSHNGGLKCTRLDKLCDVCCHLANMMEEHCRLLPKLPNHFGNSLGHMSRSHTSILLWWIAVINMVTTIFSADQHVLCLLIGNKVELLHVQSHAVGTLSTEIPTRLGARPSLPRSLVSHFWFQHF